MRSNSSSPSPYPVRETTEGYLFTTDIGQQYLPYFRSEAAYFAPLMVAPHILTVGLKPMQPEQGAGVDARTEVTVCWVLGEVLMADARTVLFYICSAEGGRQLVRQRKFRQWYERAPATIKRIELAAGGEVGALLYRLDNPFAAELALVQELYPSRSGLRNKSQLRPNFTACT